MIIKEKTVTPKEPSGVTGVTSLNTKEKMVELRGEDTAERAAILEFDGGFTREEEERIAGLPVTSVTPQQPVTPPPPLLWKPRDTAPVPRCVTRARRGG